MKLVINRCYGGFSLSHEAMMRYAEIKGIKFYPEEEAFGFTTYYTVPKDQRVEPKEGEEFYKMSLEERRAYNKRCVNEQLYDRDLERDDPVLVQVVEELGSKADGRYAELEIVEIPDDVRWQIEEYDGKEWVAEQHRTW